MQKSTRGPSGVGVPITLAPKKLIRTRRASEGSASEPLLARRVSMCKDAKLSCRGNSAAAHTERAHMGLAEVPEVSRPDSSPEAELREILVAASKQVSMVEARARAAEIRQRLSGRTHSDSAGRNPVSVGRNPVSVYHSCPKRRTDTGLPPVAGLPPVVDVGRTRCQRADKVSGTHFGHIDARKLFFGSRHLFPCEKPHHHLARQPTRWLIASIGRLC